MRRVLMPELRASASSVRMPGAVRRVDSPRAARTPVARPQHEVTLGRFAAATTSSRA